MNFGDGKVIHVVMTSSQDRYAVLSCVGAFSDFGLALDYARQLMNENCIDEGIGYGEDEVQEDDSQYAMVISHEESDFKVIIDYCADRTGESNERGSDNKG